MLDRDAEAAKLQLLRININKLAGTASVRHETIVNVFPGMDDAQRLVIAVEQESDGESRLVLRQESYSEAVGWFVQSRVAIEPNQVAGLKMSLGGTNNARRISPPKPELPDSPAILRFPAAAAG